MRNFIRKIIGILVLFFSVTTVAQNGINVSQLQTEMLTNPEGIDVKQPRFSWTLQSKLNQIKQIAYQITVASSLEKLNTATPDLWDSGKVISGESINLVYSGKKLNNRQDAFWKVKIWTNKGEAVATDVAHFSMGIMTYADWKSTRWIGYDKISPEAVSYTHLTLPTKRIV